MFFAVLEDAGQTYKYAQQVLEERGPRSFQGAWASWGPTFIAQKIDGD